MRLRCRGPSGQSVLTLQDDATGADLLARAVAATGIASLELLAGFPPQALSLDPSARISDQGLRDGDSLTVRERRSAPVEGPGALGAGDAADAGAAPAAPPRAGDAGVPPGPLGGVVVRRQVPSDNSCLFRSVSYVMERTEERHGDLRRAAAQAIRADPARFSAGFLGKGNEEYARWLEEPDSWGGAIELMVLSEHYR